MRRISCSPGDWLPLLRTIEDAPDSVALSIDDGPTPETTPHIIAHMKRFDAHATFFLSGVRVAQFPDLVAEIVHAGHDVFAHGWDHIHLDRAGPNEPFASMERCENLLRAHRPTPDAYLVRLPYAAGYRDRRVHREMRRWNPGAQMALWQLSFLDYLAPPRCRGADDIRRVCRDMVAQTLSASCLPGSILLSHDNPFDIVEEHRAQVSVVFMEEVLIALAARGLKSVVIRPRTKSHPLSRFVLI